MLVSREGSFERTRVRGPRVYGCRGGLKLFGGLVVKTSGVGVGISIGLCHCPNRIFGSSTVYDNFKGLELFYVEERSDT